MIVVDLFWNLLLLGADVAAFAWVRRKRTARAAFEAVVAGGFAAAVGGVLLGGGFFGITRLWAWAIFLHGPLVLGACAGPWGATNALSQFSVAVGVIAEDGSCDLRAVLTVSAYKGKRVVTSVQGTIPEWAIRVVKEAYQVEQ